MSRAGAEAFRLLRGRWPDARAIVALCGAGNNAGDGLVLARHAKAAGLDTRVLAVAPPERLKGDAKRALDECVAAGITIERFAGIERPGDGGRSIVVDALLGIGADRPLTGDFAAAVATANALGAPILALDIPSGLHADSGLPLGCAIRATATVTFVGLKQGLYLGRACDYTGDIELADLGLSKRLAHDLEPALTRLALPELVQALPPRPRSAHKGTSGRLLLLGGGPGMSGAIRLACEAALRVGAGLVYVAAHRDSAAAVRNGRPEVIVHAVEAASELSELIDLADAAVVGPGLGRSDWARACLGRLLESGLPLVADADALNLVAAAPAPRGNWAITPHPAKPAACSAAPSSKWSATGSPRSARSRLVTTQSRSSRVRGRSSLPRAVPRRSAIAATREWRAAGWATCLRGRSAACWSKRTTSRRARARACCCTRSPGTMPPRPGGSAARSRPT